MLRKIADDRIEPLQIDGLRKMSKEARLLAARNILIHAETGKRHRRSLIELPDFLQEIHAGTVGQADIAKEQIKLFQMPDRLALRQQMAVHEGHLPAIVKGDDKRRQNAYDPDRKDE